MKDEFIGEVSCGWGVYRDRSYPSDAPQMMGDAYCLAQAALAHYEKYPASHAWYQFYTKPIEGPDLP